MKYHGVATLADGSVLEMDGSIIELCIWADQVSEDADGDVKICIGRLDHA